MLRVFAELGRFVVTQRKFWLIPVLVFLVVILLLVVASVKGGAVAPFIYPLF